MSSSTLDSSSDYEETDMNQILQNYHCVSCKELIPKLVQSNPNDLFVLLHLSSTVQPPSTPRKEECSRPLEGFLTPNLVTSHLREMSDQIREFSSDNISPPMDSVHGRVNSDLCEYNKGMIPRIAQKQILNGNQVKMKETASPGLLN